MNYRESRLTEELISFKQKGVFIVLVNLVAFRVIVKTEEKVVSKKEQRKTTLQLQDTSSMERTVMQM